VALSCRAARACPATGLQCLLLVTYTRQGVVCLGTTAQMIDFRIAHPRATSLSIASLLAERGRGS
jgi:hypothetical protein